MNTKELKVVGLIFAFAGAVSMVQAVPGGEGGRKGGKYKAMLEKYDADGDGTLSEEERKKMKADFAARRGEKSKRTPEVKRPSAEQKKAGFAGKQGEKGKRGPGAGHCCR